MIRVQMRGGTNASHAPQTDYCQRVFAPLLRQFGGELEVVVQRRGFYPEGQGIVECAVSPVRQLDGVELLERGAVERIIIMSVTAGRIGRQAALEAADAAAEELSGHFVDAPMEKEAEWLGREHAWGTGGAVMVLLYTSSGCILSGDALYVKGSLPSQVGRDAAQHLIQEWGGCGCVDRYGQDQIVVLMALAAGRSRVRIGPMEMHTETAIHFAQLMTGATFRVEPATDGQGGLVLEAEGIGLVNRHLQQGAQAEV